MRTTVSFDDDTAAAVNRLRREGSRGVSEIVNDLIRVGLRHREERPAFVQSTSDLGIQTDVSNIAEALDLLEGPDHR